MEMVGTYGGHVVRLILLRVPSGLLVSYMTPDQSLRLSVPQFPLL